MRSSAPLVEPGSTPERDLIREYEELVNSLDVVVFRFDRGGRWNFLSPAWQRCLGWGTADCLGRAAAKFVHRDQRGEVLRNWSEVLAGRQQSYRREVRFLTAGGGSCWMLVSARGKRDRDGALRGVTGTLTDISAAKAAEAELIAARAAAEGANKSKSEFLSTMSHELRTPLNAVIGLSESLLELGAPFDPERTPRYLGIIHQSGRQLLAQINDILDLARIEAGRITLNADTIDFRALCVPALEGVQREVRAKQLVATIHPPPQPVFVHGDERLLRQALQNLVSNAVKFTPAGGRVTVTLEALPSGAARVAVSDTGIGISPEKIDLLFKPFSQVDSSLGRKFGGTGLGLALVERILRLHGGTVSVTSRPGEGSTFTLELPPAALPAAPAGPPRSRRVVLVDDDPHQHTLVGDFLRRRGFEVISCEDAPAALVEITRAEPGLAIVDINLPGMTGLELIACVRALPERHALPILAVTALAEADAAEGCRRAGANAHLAKPLALTALAERIHRLTHLTV